MKQAFRWRTRAPPLFQKPILQATIHCVGRSLRLKWWNSSEGSRPPELGAQTGSNQKWSNGW
eukprot:11678272-Alexandrium_andersonii.AAC.1